MKINGISCTVETHKYNVLIASCDATLKKVDRNGFEYENQRMDLPLSAVVFSWKLLTASKKKKKSIWMCNYHCFYESSLWAFVYMWVAF